jgi:hypothetical protein
MTKYNKTATLAYYLEKLRTEPQHAYLWHTYLSKVVSPYRPSVYSKAVAKAHDRAVWGLK